jgi:hypothetical protein
MKTCNECLEDFKPSKPACPHCGSGDYDYIDPVELEIMRTGGLDKDI